ncbi:hypothetical protein APA386B_1754 [Acetobacter pasteurianus 386B]|nr:hypothetical protein APA386B_1754 [Acetobacter pasteurianus 386B]
MENIQFSIIVPLPSSADQYDLFDQKARSDT